MSDDKMFAELLETQSQPPRAPANDPRRRPTRQLHFALTEDVTSTIDRYFMLLYQTDRRVTKSEIVGLAIRVLDRVLQEKAPSVLDESVLDDYVRTHRQPDTRPSGHTGGSQMILADTRPSGRKAPYPSAEEHER